MDGNRGEAERWLFTANKLLSARDLHGARSFAIRARESDPRLETTELLLAIIDTLLAGEVRIKDHLDYYSILQILRYTHNIDYIADQYRRLAVLLDPHRNPFAFAAHAFSLINDAYSVLCNPNKKAFYDDQLRLLTQPPPPNPPPPPPPPQPPIVQLPPTINLNNNYQQQQHRKNPNSSKQARLVVAEQHQHNNGSIQYNVAEQSRSRPHDNSGPTHFTITEPSRPRPRPEDNTGPSYPTVTTGPNNGPIYPTVTETIRPRHEEDLSGRSHPTVTEPIPSRPDDTNVPPHPAPIRPRPDDIDGPSFWTACPYCFVMYEYPKEYVECTMRCQSCRRGYHAAVVRSPPELTGDGGYYCSWGFFPLGFSGNFKEISGSSSDWNPFSPLFPCPLKGGSPNNKRLWKEPVIYYDEEECAEYVEAELSDSSSSDDTDDEDWQGRKEMKTGRRRRRRRKGSYGGVERKPIERPRRGIHSDSVGNDNVNGSENVGNEEAAADDDDDISAPEIPSNAVRPESSKKAALVGSKRRGAGNLGKLDLNVEFSNEVEEPATRVRGGNEGGTGNAEDNIEGIGFFEGLDEFLSSLPILNAVADDKVKT